jgi:uncharacterized membrane protein
MDITLLNLNAIFLFLVGLVPFTTHFLGLYTSTRVGITVYAINVALIGLSLLWMRIYIERSPSIDQVQRTPEQIQGALIRILTPVVFSLLAIPVSFISPAAAFGILLLAVAYNFHNNAADFTRRVLGRTVFNRLFEHNLRRIADHQASGDGIHRG